MRRIQSRHAVGLDQRRFDDRAIAPIDHGGVCVQNTGIRERGLQISLDPDGGAGADASQKARCLILNFNQYGGCSHAAIIVRDRDGGGVDAVVEVHVFAEDTPSGRLARASLGDRNVRVCHRSRVPPVDRGGERFNGPGQRVGESGIGEIRQVQADLAPFADRQRSHRFQTWGDVGDRGSRGRRSDVAVAVANTYLDRVAALISVDMPCEQTTDSRLFIGEGDA